MDSSLFMSLQTLFHLNCYCNLSLIILWNWNGTAIFLHCREGMKQGYPLDMVDYGIIVLPLVKNLKAVHPDIT